jgi:sialate O-acetylesterase
MRRLIMVVAVLIVLTLVFVLTRFPVPAAAGKSVSLKLAAYFTSHMVLQRGMSVPVWGTAPAGTPITVTFQNPFFDQSVSTTTAADGQWRVRLDSMFASNRPGTMVVRGGASTISLTDVLVGDVWVLSGQSNMNFPLKNSEGGATAARAAGLFPHIRLYLIPGKGGLSKKWQVSDAATVSGWSAVGFFFARTMHNLLVLHHSPDVIPIGLIQVARDGSTIADWTIYGGGKNGKLYKEKIRPLQPYAVRGILWYQGETDGENESSALKYYEMLPELIENWRADWDQGEFPFLYAQLPPIADMAAWTIVRDAQVSTLDVTINTAMACIIDVPTVPAGEIHPPAKEPVGERLALAAFAQVFPDLNVVHSGPIRNPNQSIISAGTIVVKFDSIDGGLVTSDGTEPGPFMIAGEDGVYYPATATISSSKDGVVLANPSSVPNPKSVRYCWDSYPSCNLFNDNDGDYSNGYGLPASPFQLTLD